MATRSRRTVTEEISRPLLVGGVGAILLGLFLLFVSVTAVVALVYEWEWFWFPKWFWAAVLASKFVNIRSSDGAQ